MLRKLLSKSGRRILRAIKKFSTRRLESKRLHNLNSWRAGTPDLDDVSLSCSLPSLDTKSIDTYMTYVGENFEEREEDGEEEEEECTSRYCCCNEYEENQRNEYEENQRNENRENEMMIY